MSVHVVVTFYRKTPDARPIVHAYGPYTESRAKAERTRMLAEHAADVEAGRLIVTANKTINIAEMNGEQS